MKNLFKKIEFRTLSVKTQARKPFLQKLKTATSGKLISSENQGKIINIYF